MLIEDFKYFEQKKPEEIEVVKLTLNTKKLFRRHVLALSLFRFAIKMILMVKITVGDFEP